MANTTMMCRRAALALLTAGLLAAAPTRAQEPARPGFYQDFRGSRRPQAPLVPFGPQAEQCSKPEEEGWRIRIPAQQPKITTTGLQLTTPVQGDFTITVGYQILQADRPQDRLPAGFELHLTTQTPTQEAIGLYRVAHRGEGDIYSCHRMTTGTDGKRRNNSIPIPAQSKSGSLRLIRAGAEVTFWADEGTGEFQQLARYTLGPEDVTRVRFAAYAPP